MSSAREISSWWFPSPPQEQGAAAPSASALLSSLPAQLLFLGASYVLHNVPAGSLVGKNFCLFISGLAWSRSERWNQNNRLLAVQVEKAAP